MLPKFNIQKALEDCRYDFMAKHGFYARCLLCNAILPGHTQRCSRRPKTPEELTNIKIESYKKSITQKEPKMQKFKLNDRVITEDGRTGTVIIPNADFNEYTDKLKRCVVQLDTGQVTTWLQDNLKKELQRGDVVYIPATIEDTKFPLHIEVRPHTCMGQIDKDFIKTQDDFK